MSVTTKTWTFNTDTESWVLANTSDVTVSRITTDGSPDNGCLSHVLLVGRNKVGTGTSRGPEQTWATMLGITSGSTIESVRLYWRKRVTGFTQVDIFTWDIDLYTNRTGSYAKEADLASGSYTGTDASWVTTGDSGSVDITDQLASYGAYVRIYTNHDTGNNAAAAAAVLFDYIQLEVTYTLPSTPVTVSPPAATTSNVSAKVPTVTAVKNVSISIPISTINDVSAKIPTLNVAVGTTNQAPTVTATVQASIPSVIAQRNINNITPSAESLAEALVSSVSAIKNVNISSGLAIASSSANNPEIIQGYGSVNAPNTSLASAEALVGEVICIQVIQINSPTATSNANANVPTVTSIQNRTIEPPVIGATAQAYIQNVFGGTDINIQSVPSESTSISHEPQVFGHSNMSSISALSSGSAIAPTVITNSTIQVGTSASNAEANIPQILFDLSVWFQYRKIGDSTWLESPKQSLEESGNFNQRVCGLEDETQYEYRTVAQYFDEIVYGEILTFETGINVVNETVYGVVAEAASYINVPDVNADSNVLSVLISANAESLVPSIVGHALAILETVIASAESLIPIISGNSVVVANASEIDAEANVPSLSGNAIITSSIATTQTVRAESPAVTVAGYTIVQTPKATASANAIPSTTYGDSVSEASSSNATAEALITNIIGQSLLTSDISVSISEAIAPEIFTQSNVTIQPNNSLAIADGNGPSLVGNALIILSNLSAASSIAYPSVIGTGYTASPFRATAVGYIKTPSLYINSVANPNAVTADALVNIPNTFTTTYILVPTSTSINEALTPEVTAIITDWTVIVGNAALATADNPIPMVYDTTKHDVVDITDEIDIERFIKLRIPMHENKGIKSEWERSKVDYSADLIYTKNVKDIPAEIGDSLAEEVNAEAPIEQYIKYDNVTLDPLISILQDMVLYIESKLSQDDINYTEYREKRRQQDLTIDEMNLIHMFEYQNIEIDGHLEAELYILLVDMLEYLVSSEELAKEHIMPLITNIKELTAQHQYGIITLNKIKEEYNMAIEPYAWHQLEDEQTPSHISKIKARMREQEEDNRRMNNEIQAIYTFASIRQSLRERIMTTIPLVSKLTYGDDALFISESLDRYSQRVGKVPELINIPLIRVAYEKSKMLTKQKTDTVKLLLTNINTIEQSLIVYHQTRTRALRLTSKLDKINLNSETKLARFNKDILESLSIAESTYRKSVLEVAAYHKAITSSFVQALVEIGDKHSVRLMYQAMRLAQN